ncbi:MAG: hypothetical protein WCH46_07495 [bacterium]
MGSERSIIAFFETDEAHLLKEAAFLRTLAETLPTESTMLYDLTFHATFAKRIFEIIKREGPQTQGFDRMQHSFTESVEKIRGILRNVQEANGLDSTEFTDATPQARARLTRLIEDLALLKNWLNAHEIK